MARTITAYSVNNNVAHYANMSDEDGVQAVGGIAAIFGGGETRKYTFNVPLTLATGYYTFSLHRDSNDALRSQGEFYWDNVSASILSSAEYNYLINSEARFDTLDTAHAATLAAVNALAIPTAAAIAIAVEAALLDDGDGQAFRAGLAATIEAALANEADGNATIAVFQGAVTAALTLFDPATAIDVDLARLAVQNTISNLNDISVAEVQVELVAYDAATAVDVELARLAVQNTVSNLNDISTAEVQAELAIYDAATAVDVDLARLAVQNTINNLNNISVANIQSELAAYDAATGAELASALTNILNSAGLTTAQQTELTRIVNIIEADEVYSATGGVGTVQKLLKGTTTVLQTKDVTTSTPCDIATSIIEQ